MEVDMLTKIERREEKEKLRGESVSAGLSRIAMNVKVTSDDKFVVAAKERKELKSLRKTENGLE